VFGLLTGDARLPLSSPHALGGKLFLRTRSASLLFARTLYNKRFSSHVNTRFKACGLSTRPAYACIRAEPLLRAHANSWAVFLSIEHALAAFLNSLHTLLVLHSPSLQAHASNEMVFFAGWHTLPEVRFPSWRAHALFETAFL